MTEISRERYLGAVATIAKARLDPQSTVDAVIAALGLKVVATPEERIAAFIAAARTFEHCRADDFIWKVIDSHFPEVRGR